MCTQNIRACRRNIPTYWQWRCISAERVIPNSPVTPLSLAQLSTVFRVFTDTQSKQQEAKLWEEKEVMKLLYLQFLDPTVMKSQCFTWKQTPAQPAETAAFAERTVAQCSSTMSKEDTNTFNLERSVVRELIQDVQNFPIPS